MSEVTRLHVFDQLISNQEIILDKVSLLLSKQPNRSIDATIKQAVEISREIQDHFHQEDCLIDQVRKYADVKDVVAEYDESKTRINNAIADIVSGKPDKQELHSLVRKLLGEIRVYSEFEEVKLLKRIGRYATAKELDTAYRGFAKVVESEND